jgi:hypothetical protein
VTRSRTAALLASAAIFVTACTSEATSSGEPSESTLAGATASSSVVSSPSMPPSAAPTAESSETGAQLTITWEESETFEGQVLEVFADGDSWIAGGWDAEDGPAAWTSSDARTWVPSDVENQQPDDTFAGPRFGPIARLGDSLLSFGTLIGGGDGRGVYGWRSANGTTWDAIESTSPLFEHGYLVREVAAAETSLVAVENQYVEFAGRFWTWTESTSWVETTPDASGGQFSGVHLNDVVWSGDQFVAVGARRDGDFRVPPTGTSWVSTDGRTWEESVPTEAMNGVTLAAVASLPDGTFVAIGDAASPEATEVTAVVFTSPDGLSWTPASEPFPASLVWPVGDLLEVPGGVVAFGGSDIWSTSDGIRWAEAGSLEAPFATVAAMGDEIVVFTSDYEHLSWAIQRGVIGR